MSDSPRVGNRADRIAQLETALEELDDLIIELVEDRIVKARELLRLQCESRRLTGGQW